MFFQFGFFPGNVLFKQNPLSLIRPSGPYLKLSRYHTFVAINRLGAHIIDFHNPVSWSCYLLTAYSSTYDFYQRTSGHICALKYRICSSQSFCQFFSLGNGYLPRNVHWSLLYLKFLRFKKRGIFRSYLLRSALISWEHSHIWLCSPHLSRSPPLLILHRILLKLSPFDTLFALSGSLLAPFTLACHLARCATFHVLIIPSI